MSTRTLATLSLEPPFGPLGRVRALVRQHPFASYVALAWALSWSYWVAMLVRGEVAMPGGAVTHFPGLLGPLVAAFAITALTGGIAGVRDLCGRMLRWRVSPHWYALAALPFVVFLAGAAFLTLAGGEAFSIAALAQYSGLPELGLPLVVLLAFVFNGLGEEVGWRGFAQPTLRRRHGLVPASLAVAAVWAVWHAPSFWVVETYRQMGLGIVPIFTLGLGSGAIVFGWLYERSGGSILIAALAHLGLNLGSATDAARGLPAMLVTTGIVVWAVLIVAAEARRGAAGRGVLAHWRDAALIGLLRSRLGRGPGRGMTVIEYRGRRSGRPLATPVEYVRDGARLLVLVADASRKQWWRNVQADGDVRVLVDGVSRSALATVVTGDAAADAFAAYVAARPRAVAALGSAVAVVATVQPDVA